jgi:hypothetical protein
LSAVHRAAKAQVHVLSSGIARRSTLLLFAQLQSLDHRLDLLHILQRGQRSRDRVKEVAAGATAEAGHVTHVR